MGYLLVELLLSSALSDAAEKELGDAIAVAEILSREVYNPTEEAASGKIIIVGHRLAGGDPEKAGPDEDPK